MALSGKLLDGRKIDTGDGKMIRMCTYQDSFGRQLSFEIDAGQLCPPTLRFPPYYGPL